MSNQRVQSQQGPKPPREWSNIRSNIQSNIWSNHAGDLHGQLAVKGQVMESSLLRKVRGLAHITAQLSVCSLLS